MKTVSTKHHDSLARRIPWIFTVEVEVPDHYQKYLWDYPEGKAPLEMFLVRLFTYGRFEDIRWVFQQYPQQSFNIVSRYPDIRRGVKYWIKRWHEKQL